MKRITHYRQKGFVNSQPYYKQLYNPIVHLELLYLQNV